MKINILNGSPHKNGVTMTALLEALAACGLPSARVFDIYERNVDPCYGCGGCEKSGVCVREDGFLQLYNELLDCELLIIAFPNYFDGFPAPLKAFVDRLQCRFAATFAAGKKPQILRAGVAFVTAGSSCAPPVSSRTFSHIFAVLGAEYRGMIFENCTDKSSISAANTAAKLSDILKLKSR